MIADFWIGLIDAAVAAIAKGHLIPNLVAAQAERAVVLRATDQPGQIRWVLGDVFELSNPQALVQPRCRQVRK